MPELTYVSERRLAPSITQYEPRNCGPWDGVWRGGLLTHLSASSQPIRWLMIIFAEKPTVACWRELRVGDLVRFKELGDQPPFTSKDAEAALLEPLSNEDGAVKAQCEIMPTLQQIIRLMPVANVIVGFA